MFGEENERVNLGKQTEKVFEDGVFFYHILVAPVT